MKMDTNHSSISPEINRNETTNGITHPYTHTHTHTSHHLCNRRPQILLKLESPWLY